MSQNEKSTGSTSVGSSIATLDAWEPIVQSIRAKAESMDNKKRKLVIGGTLLSIAVVSVLFGFINVPRFVHAAVGIPLGAMLFCIFIGSAHLYHLKRPDTTTLRARYPAMARVKIALGLFALLAIFLLIISTRVPYILGGIIAISTALCIYEFMRRDREEILLNESGQLDPRDAARIAKNAAKDTQKENEEILKLLNELPPEKREMLKEGKVSEALVVEEPSKKRSFLGKRS